VSTQHRQAWLQYGGKLAYGPVRVGLGRPSHPTPHGRFRVAWKDAEHTSSTYGLDMPYSVFFAFGGVAFHQGPLDEPSHGCVHLAPAAAARFFTALQRGDRVHVF
jgi:lipoprotein-anchoring transpeptidase ErfK/SrfK